MGLFRRKKRGVAKVEAQVEAIQSELIALRKDAGALVGNIGKAAGNAIETAEPWRPYRTLACLYLWRSLAATPV